MYAKQISKCQIQKRSDIEQSKSVNATKMVLSGKDQTSMSIATSPQFSTSTRHLYAYTGVGGSVCNKNSEWNAYVKHPHWYSESTRSSRCEVDKTDGKMTNLAKSNSSCVRAHKTRPKQTRNCEIDSNRVRRARRDGAFESRARGSQCCRRDRRCCRCKYRCVAINAWIQRRARQ